MTRTELGDYIESVREALLGLQQDRVAERLWAKDASLWTDSDTTAAAIFSRLGWLTIVDEMEQHTVLIAQRFGDLVDEWGTVNEPINYLIAGYGLGAFPPGRNTIFSLEDDGELVILRASRTAFDVVRRYTVAQSATWTQPTISGNRLYIKDVSTLALWTLD